MEPPSSPSSSSPSDPPSASSNDPAPPPPPSPSYSSSSPPVAPYVPPSLPSSYSRIALASRSYRSFGLDSPAWRAHRERWRRTRRGEEEGGSADGGGARKSCLKATSYDYDSSSDDSADEGKGGEDLAAIEDREEEDGRWGTEEMSAIVDALWTCLQEEAGGRGSAGFHSTKVANVRRLEFDNDAAVIGADLIPCDSATKEPVDPLSLFSVDEDAGEIAHSGKDNDEFYLNGLGAGDDSNDGPPAPRFQLRLTVSRARVGLAAERYRRALFAERTKLASEGGDIDADRWVAEREELSALRQNLIDAAEANPRRGDGGVGRDDDDDAPLGFYVQLSLLEPNVASHESIAAPPPESDKAGAEFRPVLPGAWAGGGEDDGTSASALRTREEEERLRLDGERNGDHGAVGSGLGAFAEDVRALPQFVAPGPWERKNLDAFKDVALDVRMALARAEFPTFPEGLGGTRTFREVYQLNARLKSGSFATVCRGTHRSTGKKVAIKCVLRKDLPPSDDAAIYDEVLILSVLRSHPYVCPLVDFFEEAECYFLVMELMSGGDLFDRIGKRGEGYTESDARDLCRKMLESVRHCHENDVAHCDMKPKNLLLCSEEDDVKIKLADFGFATRVYGPRSLTKQCGTPFFVAPEVLMRSPYDQQSDMWSCGVIIFLLLAGDLPFVGRSQKELFRNIVMGRYEFEEESWSNVSDDARDLVRKLLVTDPSRRLSSREAMASPWMRTRGNMLARNNLQYTSQRLKGFNARMKLRASMIAVSSVVSLKMLSARNLRRDSSVSSSAKAKKLPSFLDIPDEEEKEEED